MQENNQKNFLCKNLFNIKRQMYLVENIFINKQEYDNYNINDIKY